MILIIKAHNRLNGIKFSTIEFAFIALIIAPFAVYYILHHQFVLAFISGGIIFNCLPVVYFGINAFRKGENDSQTIWNRQAREKITAENPNMLRDTLLLAGLTLVPLVVLLIVLVETLRSGKESAG
jgi:hypothetical protein